MDSHGAAVASGVFSADTAATALRGPSQNGAAEARELRTRSRGVGSGTLSPAAQLGAALLHQAETFAIGDRVVCIASYDNTEHLAEVIDVRDDFDQGRMYYMHYDKCDKRMDEWVSGLKLRRPPTVPALVPQLSGLVSVGSLDSEAVFMVDGQKMTRHKKRRHDEVHHVGQNIEELPEIDQHLEKQHQEKTKVKNIQVVNLGRYDIDTWYYSPYPEPYRSVDRLYICEYDLKYFRKRKSLERHLANEVPHHPPGQCIYRSPEVAPAGEEPGRTAVADPPLAVYEVDGCTDKIYCQNLCLLSKLFLDHKTLYFDVEPFLFYVFCEVDAEGSHILGYFSKEKNSAEGFNLACILTLPPYQRKGYGRFIIAFSYELSKRENKIGTPEKPLSDLGMVSYRSYWSRVVLELLQQHRGNLSIKDISELTAIKKEDIVDTLHSLSLIKYWKGDHIISVTPRIIEEHLRTMSSGHTIEVDPGCSFVKARIPPVMPMAKKTCARTS